MKHILNLLYEIYAKMTYTNEEITNKDKGIDKKNDIAIDIQKNTELLDSLPDISFLKNNFSQALVSFYETIEKIKEDNPVDVKALSELTAKSKSQELKPKQLKKLSQLVQAAERQGKAVGAVMGFFLKYKPYPMLSEIRNKESVFQPTFGPILVAKGNEVRDALSRHSEFSVAPYGVEMSKSMTSQSNGGYDSFILSTDNDEKFIPDKTLLTSVVKPEDTEYLNILIHEECVHRVREAVTAARKSGCYKIDVVNTVARFVPVVLGHHYLGVPIVAKRGCFELTEAMLSYYGEKVVGPDGTTVLPTVYIRPDGTKVDLPDTALCRNDGIIPDEQTVYNWIRDSFRHFFNNVEKDIEVAAKGIRAYRELLVYLLREVEIKRQELLKNPESPSDTMLVRLLKIQMGITPFYDLKPEQVCDLRIAENVMGTIVGAIAGQEEATCRVVDSIMKLKEGDYENKTASSDTNYGSFEQATEIARTLFGSYELEAGRITLNQYVNEALRLEPQGEVLLRLCVEEGAVIGESKPIRAGSLVFVSHGSAMQDVDEPRSFILGRPPKNYLQYGHGRHKCLGQYISPILIRESLVALLSLENLRRAESQPEEPVFPFDRRTGQFQLDDNNLYAERFELLFDEGGSTARCYSDGQNRSDNSPQKNNRKSA